MRFYYANQPAAILIGLLSVAIVVALAAVFLPLIFGLLVVAVGAAALFWAWNWLKVKMGWAQPSPYADFAENDASGRSPGALALRRAFGRRIRLHRDRRDGRDGRRRERAPRNGDPPPLEDERRRDAETEVSTIPTHKKGRPHEQAAPFASSAPQRSGEIEVARAFLEALFDGAFRQRLGSIGVEEAS